MSAFRLRFVAVLAALFVCCGYAELAVCGCDETDETAAHAQPGSSSHEGGEECDCICHQPVSSDTSIDLCFARAAFHVVAQIPDPSGFPPDAVPIGIDHPPQLA